MQQVATPLSESGIELIIKKNKCSLISYYSYMKYISFYLARAVVIFEFSAIYTLILIITFIRERFYPINKFQLMEFNLLVERVCN